MDNAKRERLRKVLQKYNVQCGRFNELLDELVRVD